MTILFALTLLLPFVAPQASPGVAAALEGGGGVTMRRDGDALHVTVTGPRAGLASLCVGDDRRIRILHASAAVWPASMDDDCRSVKIAQGYLPETARFTPERWRKVQ